MNADALHSLVTTAIWRAEQLDEGRLGGSAPLAWAEVSSLEEELATVLPVSQPEGRIARRGAVRAALKAQDHARAHALAERYLAEKEAPKSLRMAIREILEEDPHAQETLSRLKPSSDVMSNRRDPLEEELLRTDDEFRRLYEEHQEYERRLQELNHKLMFSQEDEIEEKRIRLHKLVLKDQMAEILRTFAWKKSEVGR